MSTEVVHRLGVALCVVVGVWALARALGAARRERRTRRRLKAVVAVGMGPAVGTGSAVESASGGRRLVMRGELRRWLPVFGALSVCWAVVGGVTGVVVGLVAGFGMWRWQRRPAPVEEFDVGLATRQLPLAADLLAACIAAGAGPAVAAQAVGEALDGPVGQRLARGAAEVRLGGEPAQAWQGLAALPGARGLARLLERAGESGVPAAGPVARIAAEARAEWGRPGHRAGGALLPARVHRHRRAARGDRARGRGAGWRWWVTYGTG